MPKIRKDSQNKRIPSGFFYVYSEGIAQSSNLMIFRHPLLLQSWFDSIHRHSNKDKKLCNGKILNTRNGAEDFFVTELFF